MIGPQDNGHALPRQPLAFGIIALAALAGGLSALSQVLSGLPKDFPVPIAVVQHLLNLDISWQTEKLKLPICACLARESELEYLTSEGVNRRGKLIQLQVTFTSLRRGDQEPHGVTLFVEATEDMVPSR